MVSSYTGTQTAMSINAVTFQGGTTKKHRSVFIDSRFKGTKASYFSYVNKGLTT